MAGLVKFFAALAFALAVTPAIADDTNAKIWGFRGPPTYRAMKPTDLYCNERPGETPEQIAAMRYMCEEMGAKWQGRLNWNAYSKKRQREIDEILAKPAGL